MLIDIHCEQFTQAVKENDERNNVLKQILKDKVKVVRPKTQSDTVLDFFRRDPKYFRFILSS